MSSGDLKPGVNYRLEHRAQPANRQVYYVRLTEKCFRAISEYGRKSNANSKSTPPSISIKFDDDNRVRGKLLIPALDKNSQGKILNFDRYGQNDGAMRVASIYKCQNSCPNKLVLLGNVEHRISVNMNEIQEKVSATPPPECLAMSDEQLEALKIHCVCLLSGLDGWIGRRELVERLNKEMYGKFSNYHRTVRRDLLDKAMKIVADQMDGASATEKSREPHFRLNMDAGIRYLKKMSLTQLENWPHFSFAERRNALRLHSNTVAIEPVTNGKSIDSPTKKKTPSQSDEKTATENTTKKAEIATEAKERQILFDEYLLLHEYVNSISKEFKRMSEQFHQSDDNQERKEIEQRINTRYDQLVESEDYRRRRRRYEELYKILLPYCQTDDA